jgi:hypothetical protein
MSIYLEVLPTSVLSLSSPKIRVIPWRGIIYGESNHYSLIMPDSMVGVDFFYYFQLFYGIRSYGILIIN